MSEQWRPVVEFPGYEVSSEGRVRSLDRVILHGDATGATRTLRGRVLRQNRNRAEGGYLSVMLGAGNRRYVHRLVAAAFIKPVDGMDVAHLDNNPVNNAASNLDVVTHAVNMRALSERHAARRAAA